MTDQKLHAIFQQFDTDNSGKITHENIHYAMQKLGQQMTEQEIEEIIKQHDVAGDGVLSFEEFSAIFNDQMKHTDELMASVKSK